MSQVPVSLGEKLQERIPTSKVLVVGAGGIGCEILKNLALSGFRDIEVIDLDTIDVSNLNRQFLFRKEHVGQSKSKVAAAAILALNPSISIKAYHDSITSTEYNVNFFKRFSVVLNALDNRGARNHVNRMCLAAEVPLIESGTAGYSGQVELIKKGLTQCYECIPKPAQKTYPGCTIRNTPSEPVHCIVWAKHLFNQLFGEEDPDQDVSPDTADPEAVGDAGEGALNSAAKEDGNVERTSTRRWARDTDYDAQKLFTKFFEDDVKYLLSMENLWKTRKPPVPMSWKEIITCGLGNSEQITSGLMDMQIWSLRKCASAFEETIMALKKELLGKEEGIFLVWDKDDRAAMDFVTACANIRSHIFGIERKSRFEIKSIAGHIIPAIATTNAIVAGLVILMCYRVLEGDFDRCTAMYVRQKPNHRNMVLVKERYLERPNPQCYVCSSQNTVSVSVDTRRVTVRQLNEDVLKKLLNMVAPDVVLDGNVVISSEEGETEQNDDKTLQEMGIVDGCLLQADDFLQNYELSILVHHYEPKEKDDPPYVIDVSQIKDKDKIKDKDASGANGVEKEAVQPKQPQPEAAAANNGEAEGQSDSDDDLLIVDPDDGDTIPWVDSSVPAKKRKITSTLNEDDDVVIMG